MLLFYIILQEDNIGRPKSQFTTSHIASVVAPIGSCGIWFSIWTKESKTEWTSLMGNEKKKLLHSPQYRAANKSLWLVSNKR
jgi:hypothetical protein